ncbi:hypothetical protein FJ651_15365 [Paucihalobacter ruber]|uniref:Antitoxin component YwqK of YwqJK toxin-antitoxin module n=1 Tax=Paucihalobacter ruber TaxID=2567861 RepID=A0A506PBH4_9FLAO|nr:hypothetical protein [Paucihalobacter ruber]TPV31163.1 hypothetical protein FJ651_15365 [Paucihalobacter ruber]
MKIKYILLFCVIFSSCQNDISEKKYRNENYVFYHENGKEGKWLKINPDLENKLTKSYSTYFFPNGNRFVELEVIDSYPNRIIKYFDKVNDKLTMTSIYESDSLIKTVYENGYSRQYHSNLGRIQSEGKIENGMFQGKWKFYRNDGKTIKQIVEYLNDTLHGIREDYWENGNLKNKLINVKGKQNGQSFHYYETGEIKEKNYLKNGNLHGKMKYYYKNGIVESERNYWNNIEIDSCKSFFENGKLKSLQVIKIDTNTLITYGKEYRYYDSGELHKESEIKNNLPHGILKTFYKSGKINSYQEMNQNKIDGKFIYFHENGLTKLKGKALNNILEDSVYYFNENGKPLKTMIVQNGVIIDSLIY